MDRSLIPPPPDYMGIPAPPDATGPLAPTRPEYRPWVQAAGQALGPVGTAIGKADEAGTNLAQSLPNIPRAPLGMAVPGAGLIAGPLAQGGAAAAEALMAGKGPLDIAKDTGLGTLGGLGGGLLGMGIGKAATSLGGLPRYAEDVGSQIAAHLKENVPSYSAFEPTVKGLKEMLYSPTGQKALHDAYEKSLQAVVKGATGKSIQIPIDAAKELGMVVSEAGGDAAKIAKMLGARPGQTVNLPGMNTAPTAEEGNVLVDAGKAAQAMLGKSGTAGYRAVANALDAANLGDAGARNAYKTAMGVKDFLGELPAKGFDVLGHQADLLGPKSQELAGRGLSEIQNILAGVGGVGNMPSKGTLAGPLTAAGGVAGLLGGLTGGGHIGQGPLGGGLGAGTGAWIGHKVGSYLPMTKGLPPTQIQNLLQQLGMRGAGAILPKVMST